MEAKARVRLLLAAFGVALLTVALAPWALTLPPPIKHPPAKNPKLSTQLADLARVVAQRTAPLGPGERVTAPAGFSVAKLPKSARDAIKAGQMKVSDKGEVQVYIELNQITPENLAQLQSWGVTIQILGQPKPDKKKGEVLTAVPTVQGMLPIEMITEVAALPFVRYIRLPDYGFTSTGSVDSQGDQILQAAQARSQFGIDGTGIRVGVISGGIGGVFATGCTSCGPTSATPSPINTGDLPNATGMRNSSGVLTSVSGGIIAQSFRSDGDLEDHAQPDGPAGVNAEGTAMLEIVHDLAPGAHLYFANGGTSLEFEQAVDYIAANTDVGVDDIGFLFSDSLTTYPFDGTSAVSTNTATDLNTDTNPIRGYFTAVGNLVFEHWSEPWTPAGVTSTLTCPNGASTTGDVQLFQATSNTVDAGGVGPHAWNPLLLLVPPGATVAVFLTWNDPYAGSSNDYDLFLYPLQGGGLASSVSLACSINPQTGTQPPAEQLAYTNNTGGNQQVGILIQNVDNAAAARNFDLFVIDSASGNLQNMNFYTPSGSVPAESDAGGSPVSVVSVGATDAQTNTSGNAPATVIEPYSSQGPTEATPQSAARMKPDVTATDNVSVTGAGGFGFLDTLETTPCPLGNPSPPGCYFAGTSAAAPHAAAIATLVLQAAPCLLSSSTANTPATSRANLRNFLTSTAVPLPGISQPIPNNIEGFGLLDALAAVTAAMPRANAGANQTVNGTSPSGATVTLSGSGSDPDSCPLTFSWSGSCGTVTGASPSVTCPIGVDTETLTASNGGATSGLPTGGVQITVSDFTATASPASATVQPGQAASYTVTVGSEFGGFTNPVSLACAGLPSLSSCSFSPPGVTPGSGSATSTLTISTTAPSWVIPLSKPGSPSAPLLILWLALLLGLTAAVVLARKSSRRLGFGIASCALIVWLVAPIISCSGGRSSTPKTPGTPAGMYSVTVTGSSNQLQRSTTISLTVQ